MKPGLCVVISGTHCVGKSTLVRNLLEKHGGGRARADRVISADGVLTALGRKYDVRSTNTPGTDRLKKGELESALDNLTTPIAIAEGFKVTTFGTCPLRFLFAGQKQLVIVLDAKWKTLVDRKEARQGYRTLPEKTIQKRKNAITNIKKYRSIGVPVVLIDTTALTPDEVCERAQAAIDEAIAK